MLEGRKFLMDSVQSLTRLIVVTSQARDSWNALRITALRDGNNERLALADAQSTECEERLSAMRLKLTAVQSRMDALG